MAAHIAAVSSPASSPPRRYTRYTSSSHRPGAIAQQPRPSNAVPCPTPPMSALSTGVLPLRGESNNATSTALPTPTLSIIGDAKSTRGSIYAQGASNSNNRPRGHTQLLQSASSIDDVRSALKTLHERESVLAAQLDDLVATQGQLGRELGRLDVLRTSLGAQVIAARSIGNDMLAGAADTAGRLSDRVRQLDLEKGRVEETLRVVEQVAELKACVHGVVGSMGAPQDWEAAAGYLARAASLVPEHIVHSGFAAAIVPTVEVPDAPWVTLDNARGSLCGLFLREFEAAAKADDGAKVTRFFKLFPLIGKTEVGLDVYGKYVCQGVAGTARETLRDGTGAGTSKNRDGFFYANALTRLFEHIASIIDRHGALVERHYGTGKMVRVAERLQAEADVQGGIILDSWADDRGIERRLTDVKSYPFSFLVQSFHMPPQRMGSPRVNSPAGAAGSANARRSEDEEGVNMKEVDGLLTEMSVMLGRWALYTRFLAGNCQDPDAPETAALTVPDLVTKSNLRRKVSSKLATPYNIMMTFFFRRSVEKAFQLDEAPTGLSLSMPRPIDGNPPYIISAVDVTMYIVSTVLQRTLSTCQRDVVASVVPTLGRVLGSDFVGMIQRKMRDESYPKPTTRGGLPPEDKIVSFIVLINSLELANEYLGRVTSGWLTTPEGGQQGLKDSFPFEGDETFVVSALQNLEASFMTKTTELLNEGIQVLFNQAIKLRLRLVLSDAFRDADYTLSEGEFSDLVVQQADDPDAQDEEALLGSVVRRFEQGWESLMRPVARIMAPRPYALLLDAAAQHLSRVLEKRLWSHVGRTSGFGAVRMERDFGGMVGVVARGNYSVRELFARVLQVLMVVNMEEDEWEELVVGGMGGEGEGVVDVDVDEEEGILWVLTEDERRKARALVRV